MRKTINIILVCLGLLFLTSCGSYNEKKENDRFSSYVGVYSTEDSDIELTIFNVDSIDGVIFEIDLMEGWSISGVASINSNEATFSIIDSSTGENKGTILFEDNMIKLNILSMQKNFENNIGTYLMSKKRDVDVSSTNADSFMGLSNFSMFTEFVSQYFDAELKEWEYLGKTSGHFGSISYKNYNMLITDLYQLTIQNDRRYYAIFMSNVMDEDEFGVCEIVDGELTPFLHTKTFGNNSEIIEESYFEYQPQQSSNVEMCVWCDVNPQSTSCSISNYCDTCRCSEPRCPYMKTARSMYCGDHECNSSGCHARKCDGSSFCYAHKCIISNCTREKDRNSEYCFAHK